MKKLSIKILFLILILSNSPDMKAHNPADLQIISRIMEIEGIQKILLEEPQIIITNGLISENIEVFIDELPVKLQQNSMGSDLNNLSLEKYLLKDE